MNKDNVIIIIASFPDSSIAVAHFGMTNTEDRGKRYCAAAFRNYNK